jgi:hypothetical protein
MTKGDFTRTPHFRTLLFRKGIIEGMNLSDWFYWGFFIFVAVLFFGSQGNRMLLLTKILQITNYQLVNLVKQ